MYSFLQELSSTWLVKQASVSHPFVYHHSFILIAQPEQPQTPNPLYPFPIHSQRPSAYPVRMQTRISHKYKTAAHLQQSTARWGWSRSHNLSSPCTNALSTPILPITACVPCPLINVPFPSNATTDTINTISLWYLVL